MEGAGYFSSPVAHEGLDILAFVCEGDVWVTSLAAAAATPPRRLTSDGTVRRVILSGDGQWLAFSSAQTGAREAYAVSARGGEPRRLSHLAARWLSVSSFVRIQGRDHVAFACTAHQALGRPELFAAAVDGSGCRPLDVLGASISVGDPSAELWQGDALVSRNTVDPVVRDVWKRYGGGRTGKLWHRPAGDASPYRRLHVRHPDPLLRDVQLNISCPVLRGGRIYFVADLAPAGAEASDAEALAASVRGHVCSVDAAGGAWAQLTRAEHFPTPFFYCRNLSAGDGVLCFQRGGALYAVAPGGGAPAEQRLPRACL